MKKIIVFASLLTFIDQIIKFVITNTITLNESINVIKNFFSITYVRNFGAAFSILDGNRFFFILITFVALGLIYLVFLKNSEIKKTEVLIYSMMLSGIIGNLIDRIFKGFVIDYLDFRIFGHYFPVFNLADSLIVVSVILLLVILIKEEITCKKLHQTKIK
jgi:lipoprotein signal peptidase